MRRWLFVAVLATSSMAWAQLGQGWSVLSGKTTGAGANVITGQVGWPGIVGAFLHGAHANVDVGGQLAFNYGYEGIVTEVVPGLKLQGVLRWGIVDTGRVNFGLKFAPGPMFYFRRAATEVGMVLPVGVVVGILPSDAVVLNFGLDLPMYLRFGGGGGFWVPVLIGGGAEYFINQRMAATFNLRMGPTIRGRGPALFTLEMLVGIAYRM